MLSVQLFSILRHVIVSGDAISDEGHGSEGSAGDDIYQRLTTLPFGIQVVDYNSLDSLTYPYF